MTSDPGNLNLEVDASGQLVLHQANAPRQISVEPVRLFPLSDPGRWVALCDLDGHEVRLIEDLATLPESTRQLIEGELSRNEFIPIIQRIDRITGSHPPYLWAVQTDRGAITFSVEGEEQIRCLARHRVLVTAADGLRYQIPNTRSLDPASRRILERHL